MRAQGARDRREVQKYRVLRRSQGSVSMLEGGVRPHGPGLEAPWKALWSSERKRAEKGHDGSPIPWRCQPGPWEKLLSLPDGICESDSRMRICSARPMQGRIKRRAARRALPSPTNDRLGGGNELGEGPGSRPAPRGLSGELLPPCRSSVAVSGWALIVHTPGAAKQGRSFQTGEIFFSLPFRV